jgi:catechol 2,3-dioxygenase-like lactoylglutathione lyase family enzyme
MKRDIGVMNLSIQSILLNVSDLDRSVAFYSEVFEFSIDALETEVAALQVSESGRRQVLVLRATRGSLHAGRGAIGPRLISFEAESLDQVDLVETRLDARKSLVGRRRAEGWEAVFGFDPDRNQVSIAAGLSGGPIGADEWTMLDEAVYVVGE